MAQGTNPYGAINWLCTTASSPVAHGQMLCTRAAQDVSDGHWLTKKISHQIDEKTVGCSQIRISPGVVQQGGDCFADQMAGFNTQCAPFTTLVAAYLYDGDCFGEGYRQSLGDAACSRAPVAWFDPLGSCNPYAFGSLVTTADCMLVPLFGARIDSHCISNPVAQGALLCPDWTVPEFLLPIPITDPRHPDFKAYSQSDCTQSNLAFCLAQGLVNCEFPLLFNACTGKVLRRIPVFKAYIMSNDFSATLVGSTTKIEMTSLNISIDSDSTAWRFQAQCPRTAQIDDLQPDPDNKEIEIRINNLTWRFVIESISADERFAERTTSISGRSLSAYFSAPYSFGVTTQNNTPITAIQQANKLIENTGWSIDWQLPDWTFNTGLYRQNNQQPIKAISALAQSAGGYIQTHRAQKTLIALPRYPELPERWARLEADVAIPSSVAIRKALQWEENPEWNSINITGQHQGIDALIKRQGSAGDTPADQIIDELSVDQAQVISRARSILGSAGRYALVELEVPMSLSGLITPGMLVDYQGAAESWRALVRGNAIAVSGPGAQSIRQQIEVERHG